MSRKPWEIERDMVELRCKKCLCKSCTRLGCSGCDNKECENNSKRICRLND